MSQNTNNQLENLGVIHTGLEELFHRHTGSQEASLPDDFAEVANSSIELINSADIPNYSVNLGFLVSRKEKPYWQKEKITDLYDDVFIYSILESGVLNQDRRLRKNENMKNRLLGVEVVQVKEGQSILYKYSDEPGKGLLLPQKRQIRLLLDYCFLGYPKEDE